MPATTRNGGTVKKTREDSAGVNGATVEYPQQPSPVVYTDIPANLFRLLERAQDHGKTVNVTAEDLTNNVTAVEVV